MANAPEEGRNPNEQLMDKPRNQGVEMNGIEWKLREGKGWWKGQDGEWIVQLGAMAMGERDQIIETKSVHQQLTQGQDF